MSKKKILLAFSGGLDTTAIVPWLKDNYDADVIAYCVDMGNSPDEAELKRWAMKIGASDFIFENVKEPFAKDFAFKCVRAQALYQDDYLLGTALARPLISERISLHARKLGAWAVSHGATGKGNDQLRFEKSWAYLIPEVQVIAPWKIWDYKGRSDLIKYVASKGIEMNATEKRFSVDVNLFHRSCEGGVLENPSLEYNPKEIYEWVKTPSELSRDVTSVKIGFEKGMPVSVNGKQMSAATLLQSLNEIAGNAGIGVVDLLEERANGLKSRGVYETPGGTLLHLACKNLKHLNWDRELQTIARNLGEQYARLVYDGLWHSDARMSIDSFFDTASETLTGEIGFKLESGSARVTSRVSPYALYDSSAASFEGDEIGLYKYADGYSKTVCFPQWRAGKRDTKNGRNPMKDL
ncbi:MAG: argininosuccinate synthase [Xanthomonadaceae bacterium]|nr:argininosuccinate synthase [Xanthomonadaceae bacterium]